ncbi:MAG TPA: hydroxymethylbilane synthase, partial [Thermoanaerobaculia bacterium]
GVQAEIVPITTTGDRRQNVSLASIGGKGLFIKELEEALDAGEVDLAVHSLKDVPSIIPDQFELAAFLERADPRDAWVRLDGKQLLDLPAGAVVGTSSPRRQAQVLARAPHLRVEMIRGNVETRIGKHRQGEYAGVILAAAGLTRLGRISDATSLFSVDEMIPAAGQGIVAVEILKDRDALRGRIRAINHRASETAALIERGVLQKFGTRLDCYSPIAVHATVAGGTIETRAFVSDLRGADAIRIHETGADPAELVERVYEGLTERGANEILARTANT